MWSDFLEHEGFGTSNNLIAFHVFICWQDKHNPHLELTLSSRKKISSVLEHLNRKWGNSSVVYGELMLFPYSVHGENVMDWPRWTQDSIVSAADVYVMIGRPPVFRLRFLFIYFSIKCNIFRFTPLRIITD